MTLVEICEPLFQYVCRLNRVGRKGGRVDYGTVRAELKAIFAEMKSKADAAGGMAGPYAEVEQVLVFFTDSMILNSKLPPGWKPLSHERGELGFEEKFWDLLEEVLRDPGESATQRLGVFYVCIGLGFTGLYTGQPDYIRRKMLEISARLRGMIDADTAARICPESYESVDTRNLTQPPNRSILGMMIVLVVMVGVLLVAYVQLFKESSRRLGQSLEAIQARADGGRN
jgi:type VI protein secretion system component VasF